MKKLNNLYDEIYDINNIHKMYNSIRKTTKNKKEILNFDINMNSNIIDISNKLKNQNYKFDKYNIFLIKEPKYRLIMSETINDKLVNHLIAKYILLPLDKKLINENVATRKNKGSSYAFNLVTKYINKLQLASENIYVLKIDIKKYFYNIDHEILKNKLKKYIKDKKSLEILYNIIDSTNEPYINKCINETKNIEIAKLKDYKSKLNVSDIPVYCLGKGLPIGNMTSQFLAIFYLNDIDHYIKEILGCKYYIRYMDDLIIMDKDINKLKNILNIITNKLYEYKLITNKKTRIYNLRNGFSFLGYFFIYKNKLIIKYNNRTIRRVSRILNNEFKYNYNLYYKSIRSYKGYFMKSNTTLKNKYIINELNLFDKYINIKNDNNIDNIFIRYKNKYYSYNGNECTKYEVSYKGKIIYKCENL